LNYIDACLVELNHVKKIEDKELESQPIHFIISKSSIFNFLHKSPQNLPISFIIITNFPCCR